MWLNHDHDLVDVRLTAGGTSTAAPTGTMSAPRMVHTSGHGVLIGDDLNSAVHLRPARTTNPSGETIHTTANHPWLTADRGWVQAGQLQSGEQVITLNGSSGTVAWVQSVPGQADMYNLTVANDHTYAVGDGQWIVHNDDLCNQLPSRPNGTEPTEGILDTGQDNVRLHSSPQRDMQYVNALPPDTPALGGNWYIGVRHHVEAKAAAIMRLQGLADATLHINNTPCAGQTFTCATLLEHMLPEGATLNIHIKGTPPDALIPFTGAPDSDWPAWWAIFKPPTWRSP